MTVNQHIKIIHLEDNTLDAELTRELLFDSGIRCDIRRVFRMEDFRDILQEMLSSPCFDMILADYNMPGFDGLTALKMTREIDGDIPFVLLSGALGEELAVELLRTGATDYVLKNNMQRLPLVVNRAIEECQVRRREKLSQSEIRKARDEAQKANTAKSRFLGRISHELRTPLNAIIGYTQLMQSDPLSEEQQHSADQILKAGEHLLKLINEVLDITSIESGVIPMKITPVPLEPIIEKAVDLIRPMAREARISVNIDEGPCHLHILADKDRLTQIMINLIGNAIKYNRPGGYVFVECHEERPGFAKLVVRDTGIGIPPEKMERLFTPFDRLDLERDSAIPGTGLGLTVSKSLVENMGGTLDAISTEGKGSTFWLEIPTVEPDGTTQSNPAKTDNPEPAEGSTCKLLLIEDEVPAGEFIGRVSQRRGNYDLRITATLEDALNEIKADRPDVILIELNLPDGPGENIIQQLQGNAETSRIPIIILSADHCASRKERIMGMGVSAYFLKPAKINDVFGTINDLYKETRQSDGL